VRFWDTSAVVPLLVREPLSRSVRAVARSDSSVVVWWSTRTECISALARRHREGALDRSAVAASRRVLEELASAWTEILPSEALRQRVERLLGVHALRSADAFQLAAALLWSRGQTASHAVVSFDERLREAARREGFALLPD
jgi:hypothetical protein